ncbi:MAG: hypothetical protein QMB52_03425, partial [Propionivibrio sp.]
ETAGRIPPMAPTVPQLMASTNMAESGFHQRLPPCSTSKNTDPATHETRQSILSIVVPWKILLACLGL